jgi:hypothetical protein
VVLRLFYGNQLRVGAASRRPYLLPSLQIKKVEIEKVGGKMPPPPELV